MEVDNENVDTISFGDGTMSSEEINMEYLIFTLDRLVDLDRETVRSSVKGISFDLVNQADREIFGWSEEEYENMLREYPFLSFSRGIRIPKQLKARIRHLLSSQTRRMEIKNVNENGGISNYKLILDDYNDPIPLSEIPSFLDSFYQVVHNMFVDKILLRDAELQSGVIEDINGVIDEMIDEAEDIDEEISFSGSVFHIENEEYRILNELNRSNIDSRRREELKNTFRNSILNRMIPFVRSKIPVIISGIESSIQSRKDKTMLIFRMYNEAFFDTFDIMKDFAKTFRYNRESYDKLLMKTLMQMKKEEDREDLIERSERQENRMQLILSYNTQKAYNVNTGPDIFPLYGVPPEIVDHISTFLLNDFSGGYELFLLSEFYSDYINEKNGMEFDITLIFLKNKRFVNSFISKVEEMERGIYEMEKERRKDFYYLGQQDVPEYIEDHTIVREDSITAEQILNKMLRILDNIENTLSYEMVLLEESTDIVVGNFIEFLNRLVEKNPEGNVNLLQPRSRMANLFFSSGQRKIEEAKIVLNKFNRPRMIMHVKVYIEKSINIMKYGMSEIKKKKRMIEKFLEDNDQSEEDQYESKGKGPKMSRISSEIYDRLHKRKMISARAIRKKYEKDINEEKSIYLFF